MRGAGPTARRVSGCSHGRHRAAVPLRLRKSGRQPRARDCGPARSRLSQHHAGPLLRTPSIPGLARRAAARAAGACVVRRREPQLALAKSYFSRSELDALGFERTGVLPYVLCPDALRRHALSRGEAALSAGSGQRPRRRSRRAPNKRIEDVLRCLCRLPASTSSGGAVSSSSARRAGAGAPTSTACSASRDELGLRDVVFAGHVTQEELLGYYAVADVLVSPLRARGVRRPARRGDDAGGPRGGVRRGSREPRRSGAAGSS